MIVCVLVVPYAWITVVQPFLLEVLLYDEQKSCRYACILAFDVKIEKEAQQFADSEGVKIFQADIIYHLEDNFLKYRWVFVVCWSLLSMLPA